MSLYNYKKKAKPALWATVPALGGKSAGEGRHKTSSGVVRAYRRKPGAFPVRVQIPSRRTRIRPRSRRMTKLMAYYNEIKAIFLSAHPTCEVHDAHTHPATQVHHSRGRAGTLLLDVRYWKAVCSGAHEWIGAQPQDARRTGFLCAKGDWNRAPQDADTRKLRDLIKDITHGEVS